MKDKPLEERLEHLLRKEWRKQFDRFEIVDETGVNVIDVIKIDVEDPIDPDYAIPSDLKEFAIHRIFAVDKDELMITYLDYIEGQERFIANTKRMIEESKGSRNEDERTL